MVAAHSGVQRLGSSGPRVKVGEPRFPPLLRQLPALLPLVNNHLGHSVEAPVGLSVGSIGAARNHANHRHDDTNTERRSGGGKQSLTALHRHFALQRRAEVTSRVNKQSVSISQSEYFIDPTIQQTKVIQ